MYSFAANEVQEIYAAEEMSGEVTRVRSNTNDGEESDGDNFTADGTDYSYNKTMLSEDRLVIENVDNDVVAYLDQYGYVAYIDESAMTYDYAYVLSMVLTAISTTTPRTAAAPPCMPVWSSPTAP